MQSHSKARFPQRIECAGQSAGRDRWSSGERYPWAAARREWPCDNVPHFPPGARENLREKIGLQARFRIVLCHVEQNLVRSGRPGVSAVRQHQRRRRGRSFDASRPAGVDRLARGQDDNFSTSRASHLCRFAHGTPTDLMPTSGTSQRLQQFRRTFHKAGAQAATVSLGPAGSLKKANSCGVS